MSVEIMPGYKQTELGIVPEDWQIQSLPEALQFISGKAHEQFINEAGPYVVVNSKFISTEGSVRKYSSENFCPAKRGDVLMVMSDLPNGRALAKCYLVKEEKTYAVNQRVCIFRPIKGSSEYFYYLLNRNKYFMQFDDGVQQTHLLNPMILSCQLKVPPEPEQYRIGQTLADIDSLIRSLDQLITKKSGIQQAAMQQLLTGQRRLPGFSGKWEMRRLGDIADLYQPVTISARQLTDSGYPVYGANGVVGFFSDFNHDSPQVTVTCRGSTCGAVNRTVEKSWITGNAMVVNCDGYFDIDKDFLYFLLLGRDLSVCITGTGQPQIVRGPLANLEFKVPGELEEQRAIATILLDMDAEISNLKVRRDKACQLKQGMMQDLLTGKIRLV